MSETIRLLPVDLYCCWCGTVYGREYLRRDEADRMRLQNGQPVRDGVCPPCSRAVLEEASHG